MEIFKSVHVCVYLSFFLFLSKPVYAQQIKVSGKVIDTLQTPLAYANILAIPDNDNEAVRFAITEDNGSYKPHV
jgi:uncharacterized membrane-anchored protein YitT (DUF2179 family)